MDKKKVLMFGMVKKVVIRKDTIYLYCLLNRFYFLYNNTLTRMGNNYAKTEKALRGNKGF